MLLLYIILSIIAFEIFILILDIERIIGNTFACQAGVKKILEKEVNKILKQIKKLESRETND